MSYWILIAVGGASGAVARYAVTRVVVDRLDSPLTGTFIVNVSGSFVLGLLVGLLLSNPDWPAETRVFFGVGFLGSYTTFSTLSVATVQSFENGDVLNAAMNIGASVVVGLAAAAAGLVIGRAV